MFGDVLIAGRYNVSVDQKHRIIIPAQTKREPGETIYVVYEESLDRYILYSQKTMKELFDKIDDLILNAKSKDEVLDYKIKLLELANSVVHTTTVDKQGRIQLRDCIGDDKKASLIGGGNHLIITNKPRSK